MQPMEEEEERNRKQWKGNMKSSGAGKSGTKKGDVGLNMKTRRFVAYFRNDK